MKIIFMKTALSSLVIFFFVILTFIPRNSLAQAKANADTSAEKENTKPDSLYDNSSLRIYTDFQGYGGNNPNGIVQTEMEWWWNIFGPAFGKNRKSVQVYFFKSLHLPQIAASTLGEKFRGRQVNYDKSDTNNIIHHIHTLDLIKYSTFNISSCLNALAFNYASSKRKINLYLDFYGTLYNTELKDSLFPSDKIRVNTIGVGYNIAAEFFPANSHWNMRVSVRGFKLKLYDNNIKQNYGPMHLPDDSRLNNTYYDQKKDGANVANNIFAGEIGYSKKLNDLKKFTVSDFFLRISFYNNAFKTIADKKVNAGNNYLQVQFGIQKNFGDLVEFLKPNKDK